MIGCYCRVSTADQQLERQLDSTTAYAEDELDADLAEIEIYRDTSTGTNVERDDYKRLMADVEAGKIDAVVIHETSRLARSLQDLDRTVERVTSSGAELHFVRDNLPPFTDDDEDAMARLMLQMLGAFAEWEARTKRQNTKEGIAARKNADEEYHHGPAPLGFAKDDGRLIEGENYDRVVAVLDIVQKDELSKRQAAKELDTSRPTINRALDNADIYGL